MLEERTKQMMKCKSSLRQCGDIIRILPAEGYATDHVLGDCLLFISALEQDFVAAKYVFITYYGALHYVMVGRAACLTFHLFFVFMQLINGNACANFS